MKKCLKCQCEFEERFKFCPECGAATGASSESAMERSVGERRTMGLTPGISMPQHSMGEVPTMQGAGEASKIGISSVGAVLADRYTLQEEVGRGGFARVWKATDRKLDRIVAVKRLLEDKLEGPSGRQTIERFEREATAIAQLNHRNIVMVFDHDNDAEGHYIVMEYVEGGTLRDYLKARSGRLPVPEAIELVKGIAQGLGYAHRKNLVHRDIKPANILLHREGGEVIPKITDFGLARLGGESELSLSGFGMGTPWYMPPEQRRNAKGVNHTADIYALGKTLYELVSGETPDNVDTDKVPEQWLTAVILKCIKSTPEERYFSCDDLLQALNAGLKKGSPKVSAQGEGIESGIACPSCGANNGADVKFCEGCGAGLTRACPECQRENSIYKQYCGGCGTDVAGFLSVQDVLGRMDRFAEEKRWSRVLKETGLLEEKSFRLPGKKGRAMLARVAEMKQQGDQVQKTCDRLRQSVEKYVAQGDLASAAKDVAAFLDADPFDADMIAQSETIGRIVESVQEAIARMERFATEKRWGRVLEEAALLEEKAFRLPGTKGQAMMARAVEMKKQADQAQKTCASLRQSVEKYVAQGDFASAVKAAASYIEMDPYDADMIAQSEKVSRMVEFVQNTIGRMERFAQEKRWSRVLEEAGQLEEMTFRQLGTKGQAMLAGVAEMKQQAEQAQTTCASLRQSVEAYIAQGDFASAAKAAASYIETDTYDAEMIAQSEKMCRIVESIQEALTRAEGFLYKDNVAALGACREALILAPGDARAREFECKIVEAQAQAVGLRQQAAEALTKNRPDKAFDLWNRAEDYDANSGDDALAHRIASAVQAVETDLSDAKKALKNGNLKQAEHLARLVLDQQTVSAEAQAVLKTCQEAPHRRLIKISLNMAVLVFVILSVAGLGLRSWKRQEKISEALSSARQAKTNQQWETVLQYASQALTLDAGNAEALSLKAETVRERAAYATLEAVQREKAEQARLAAEKEENRKQQENDAHIAEKMKQEALAVEQARLAAEKAEQARLAAEKEEKRKQQENVAHIAEKMKQEALAVEQARLAAEKVAKLDAALTAACEAKSRGQWQVCAEKADEVLKLEAGNAEAIALKAESEKNLTPTFTVTAMAGGREVTANISDGRNTYTTPQTFVLTKGEYCTFTVSIRSIPSTSSTPAPRYNPATLALTADWKGPKTQRVTLEEFKGPTEGEAWTVEWLGMTLMPVAAGSFRMGSESGSDDEKPVHTVLITKPYWMGRTEVTQKQWLEVMGDSPSHFKGDDLPVECVDWSRCLAFCEKLTERERKEGRLPDGYVYRLPTEAEWEYAARGGMKGKGYTYSGGNDLALVGWYGDNSGNLTHSGGQKLANELGIHDMSGNVWEWCLDDWNDTYAGAPSDGSRWGDGTGSSRVYRGGGWLSVDACCQSADRRRRLPSSAYDYLGFRVVLASVP